MKPDLPIISFMTRDELRDWLEQNHATSAGVYVRLYKKTSGVASIPFEDLLDEGLCFGWSESMRLKGDEVSYLQKFTPRKTRGTTSERNRRHAKVLIAEGRMTESGRRMLGLEPRA